MKLLPFEKEAGLEVPNGPRFKPDKEGIVTIPESLRAYGLEAERTGLFSEVGKRWGGFGEGKLPKPWRRDAGDANSH